MKTIEWVSLLALCASGCSSAPKPDGADYAWQLPSGFPLPVVPADNPMSQAKVTLGRRLFYDVRLSWPQARACASCHVQALGFASSTERGTGLRGPTKHNAMALSVPAYQSAYLWADPRATSLEGIIAETLLDENELANEGHEADVVERFEADDDARQLFEAAFPGERVTLELAAKSLASFVRTIVSGDSPYDRFQRGDTAALTEAAHRGMNLFFSERTECYHCHAGFTFSSAVVYQGLAIPTRSYSNTGLYDLDGQGSYPSGDQGLIEVTGLPADMGKFKAPSLRNIAKSAPYQHDGSVRTLREVIEAYLAGGRSAHGAQLSPLCDSLIQGRFTTGPLSPREIDDLIAFLESLTDDTFLSDPRFSPP